MYNFDFAGAHTILDQQIRQNPEFALSYSVKAAALLFSELNRLKILQMEFFEDDDKVVTADPKRGIRQFFWAQNSKMLIYSQDSDGDENFHLFGVDLASGNVRDLKQLVTRIMYRHMGEGPVTVGNIPEEERPAADFGPATMGVKKSVVTTSARESSRRQTAASSGPESPTSRSG